MSTMRVDRLFKVIQVSKNREYFNASLMHPISKQMIAAMGDVRMHPMTYRRYMWKFEY